MPPPLAVIQSAEFSERPMSATLILMYFSVAAVLSAALTLAIAYIWGARHAFLLSMTALMIPPAAALLTGAALMIWFLASVRGPDVSGDGPAFMVIAALMLIGPVILLVPGGVAAGLVIVVLRYVTKTKVDGGSEARDRS